MNKIRKYIIRWLIDYYKSIKLYRFYNLSKGNSIDFRRKTIVAMVDGRMHHGGLSDRLSGIISSFQYCKLHNVDFRIFFVFPFRLDQFLEPNEYDWRIKPNELTYNIFQSKPVCVSMYSHDVEEQRRYTNRRIGKLADQTHLYTNMGYFYPEEFGALFNQLFKKTDILEAEISKNMRMIGGKYISITFRFQQLLGDFKETGFPVINDELERQKLVTSCMECISKLHKKTGMRILVTSDSSTFLRKAESTFSFVYVIKGDVVHMDYVGKDENINMKVHLKSFVDFFMLANAECIYLATISPLYHSYFPKMASWIYGKPFHVIY